MPETSDFLALMAVAIYLAGVGAITTRALILRRRQGDGLGLASFMLIMLTVAYIGVILLDAPSVLNILSNHVDDIPPTSTVRMAIFAAWTWVVHWVLLRLAYGRAPK